MKKLKQPFIIWVFTNLAGGFYLIINNDVGQFMYYVILLGMLWSSPTMLLLIPILGLMKKIKAYHWKIIYAIVSICFVCAIVILSVFVIFDLSYSDRLYAITLLWPYVIAAEMIFFLVTWKKNYTSEKLLTIPHEG
jgi:hypothetical protein